MCFKWSQGPRALGGPRARFCQSQLLVHGLVEHHGMIVGMHPWRWNCWCGRHESEVGTLTATETLSLSEGLRVCISVVMVVKFLR